MTWTIKKSLKQAAPRTRDASGMRCPHQHGMRTTHNTNDLKRCDQLRRRSGTTTTTAFPRAAYRQALLPRLDKHSMDPGGDRQINKHTGKEIAREDIARGYEYENECSVSLTDAEIQLASPESMQTQ